MKIEAYPALKFFINGEPIDYEGPRTEDAIENWINIKHGPLSHYVSTE